MPLLRTALLTLLLGLSLARAQTPKPPPEPGFLSLLHAVPGTQACKISIGGTELNDRGLRPGESTGGLILPSGPHEVSLEIQGLPPATGTVEVAPNHSSSYAIFLHIRTNPKTLETEKSLRLHRLTDRARGKHHLDLVSLLPAKATFELANRKITTDPLRPMRVEGWNGNPLSVKLRQQPIGAIEADEAGSYLLVIAQNAEQQVRAFTHRHVRHQLPPWHQPATAAQASP